MPKKISHPVYLQLIKHAIIHITLEDEKDTDQIITFTAWRQPEFLQLFILCNLANRNYYSVHNLIYYYFYLH